jgi:hypothetical protein
MLKNTNVCKHDEFFFLNNVLDNEKIIEEGNKSNTGSL